MSKTLSDNQSIMEDDDGNHTFWYREDFVKAFIKEQTASFKISFCLNPDVPFCGECSVCRQVDSIQKGLAGGKLI